MWTKTSFYRRRNPANYKIVVGDHNRNTNEGTEQEVGAKRIISHPNYNSPRLSSDIALIQLSVSVKLSQRVNPICLPNHDSDIPIGSKCYITGKPSNKRGLWALTLTVALCRCRCCLLFNRLKLVLPKIWGVEDLVSSNTASINEDISDYIGIKVNFYYSSLVLQYRCMFFRNFTSYNWASSGAFCHLYILYVTFNYSMFEFLPESSKKRLKNCPRIPVISVMKNPKIDEVRRFWIYLHTKQERFEHNYVNQFDE